MKTSPQAAGASSATAPQAIRQIPITGTMRTEKAPPVITPPKVEPTKPVEPEPVDPTEPKQNLHKHVLTVIEGSQTRQVIYWLNEAGEVVDAETPDVAPHPPRPTQGTTEGTKK